MDLDSMSRSGNNIIIISISKQSIVLFILLFEISFAHFFSLSYRLCALCRALLDTRALHMDQNGGVKGLH